MFQTLIAVRNQTSIVAAMRLLFVLVALASVCTANSRYNRLNPLQRQLNTQSQYANDMEYPLNSEPKELSFSDDVAAPTYTENNYKRAENIRRCGMVLLRHIQKICNGCVGRSRSSEESTRMKRSFDPFVESQHSLTDMCCKNSCDDAQLLDFCC